MPPHVTRQDLSTTAERFLEITSQIPLHSLQDAKNSAGKQFPYRNHPEEYLECVYEQVYIHHPLVLRYVVPNIGWPIEIRTHEVHGETNFIVKSNSRITGYTPFANYEDGVIAQVKQLRTLDWRDIEEEVQALILP